MEHDITEGKIRTVSILPYKVISSTPLILTRKWRSEYIVKNGFPKKQSMHVDTNCPCSQTE